MADQKLSERQELLQIGDDDLIYIVHNDGTGFKSYKVKISALVKGYSILKADKFENAVPFGQAGLFEPLEVNNNKFFNIT